MKQIVVTLRAILISPELLVIVSGTYLYFFRPTWFFWLSGRIGHEADLLKYIGFLPAGLVAYDLSLIKNILFPAADTKNHLQNWPLYREFKGIVFGGIFYALVFSVGGVSALLFDWKTPNAYQSMILVTTVVGSLITTATLFNAHIKMEESFRENVKLNKSQE